MNLLSKIRGLWRFDGDTEPVKVSRRRFILMGACAATGALLPIPYEDMVLRAWNACTGGDDVPEVIICNYDAFFIATIKAYSGALEKTFLEDRPAITLLMDGSYSPPPGAEWPRPIPDEGDTRVVQGTSRAEAREEVVGLNYEKWDGSVIDSWPEDHVAQESLVQTWYELGYYKSYPTRRGWDPNDWEKFVAASWLLRTKLLRLPKENHHVTPPKKQYKNMTPATIALLEEIDEDPPECR